MDVWVSWLDQTTKSLFIFFFFSFLFFSLLKEPMDVQEEMTQKKYTGLYK